MEHIFSSFRTRFFAGCVAVVAVFDDEEEEATVFVN
jgi:hypothetical protein